MATIFLSHSTEDIVLANSIYTLITHYIESTDKLSGEYNVFYSPISLLQFEHGSDNWKIGIQKAIEGCSCCIFLLTPNSIENRWVNYELGLATANGKKIIPIGPHGLNFKLVIRNEIQLLEISNYSGIIRILQRIFNDILNVDVRPNSWGTHPENKSLFNDIIYQSHTKTIYFVGSISENTTATEVKRIEEFITTLSQRLLENKCHLASYPSVPYIGKTVAKCALNYDCECYEIAGLYKFDNMTDYALRELNINNAVLDNLLTSLRKSYLKGKDCMVIVGGKDNTEHEYDVARKIKNLQIFPIPCFGGYAQKLFNKLKMTADFISFDHPCANCTGWTSQYSCPNIERFVVRFQEYKKLIP